jgi:hypothetical protein
MITNHNPSGLFAAPLTGTQHVWCGPSALAAVTGETPEHVESLLVAYRAKHGTPRRVQLRGYPVRSMFSTEVAPLATLLGWRAVDVSVEQAFCTFKQWRTARARARDTAPYIVLITDHFVAVCNGMFADSTYRTPIRADAYRKQRKRVVRVYRMEKERADI